MCVCVRLVASARERVKQGGGGGGGIRAQHPLFAKRALRAKCVCVLDPLPSERGTLLRGARE